MYLEILGKLASESLLSLYPTIIKNISIPFEMQLWTRFITYALVSALFVDWHFVYETLLTGVGWLLPLVTMIHVYVSYRGFQLLDGGVAYALFYTYPFMILILAGQRLSPAILVAFLGILLLTVPHLGDLSKMWRDLPPLFGHIHPIQESFGQVASNYEGIAMVLLAALTEAFIYFIVKNIKTKNNWNHLFLSYGLGAAILTGAYLGEIGKIAEWGGGIGLALGANVFIGLFGYLLRFYAISRLSTAIYAPLSYFGIFMAFVYGVAFSGETVTLQKVLGAICIVVANLWSITR